MTKMLKLTPILLSVVLLSGCIPTLIGLALRENDESSDYPCIVPAETLLSDYDEVCREQARQPDSIRAARVARLDSVLAARSAWTPSAHDSTTRQSLADDLYKLETVAKRFYTAIGKFTPDLHLMRPYMQNIKWELFGENPNLFIGLNVLNFAAQEVVITGKVLGEKSECHIRVRPPGLQKFYVECEWL